MPTLLESLKDTDGLIALRDVDVRLMQDRSIFLKSTKQQVYIDPYAFPVADLVIPRSDLSRIAKLRLTETKTGLKKLPVFGVSFEIALRKAYQSHPGALLKSMYKAENSDGSLDYGICATLVTHIQRAPHFIQIEAWQIETPGDVTYYVHGLIDPSSGNFTHLDGATMFHDGPSARSLFDEGVKIKGQSYRKMFRLDGVIERGDAIKIACAYFPLESLTMEYLEAHAESEI
jgi:hypothetical protein